MRWVPRILGAVLLAAVAAQPAAAVVITTLNGNSDAPQFATPVGFVTLFLRHQNGTVYRVTTGALGTATVDIPPGVIEWCQAVYEASLVASFACVIPIGEEALAAATSGATTQTAGESPQNEEDPSVAVVVAKQGGGVQAYRNQGSGWIPIQRDIAREEHMKYVAYDAAGYGYSVGMFFANAFSRILGIDTGGGGDGGGGGGE